jgi:transposase-like protein
MNRHIRPNSFSLSYRDVEELLAERGLHADHVTVWSTSRMFSNRITGDIIRRIRARQHFRSFWGAWRTIVGYEAIHMIRKGQCWSAASATNPNGV